MTRRQKVLATVLIVGVSVVFVGMWQPTPFGTGHAPSATDGTDKYGFPLRHRQVPSGFCGISGCGQPTTSIPRLAVNVAAFGAVSTACLALARTVA